MNSVTQDMRFRQSLLKYSQKYGVTKAAIKYKTNRQYIYRWLKRYDGTLESLREKSRRPWIMPKKVDRKSKRIIGQIGRQAIIMRMRTERVIKAMDILKNRKF